MKQLRQLQTERRAEEEKARQAAVQPTPEKAKAASAAPQPAESEAAQSTESTALEPEIGFDFSDAEIGHERPAEIPAVAYPAQPAGSQQHVAQS